MTTEVDDDMFDQLISATSICSLYLPTILLSHYHSIYLSIYQSLTLSIYFLYTDDNDDEVDDVSD